MDSRAVRAAVVSLVCLLLGFGATWVANKVGIATGDAVIVALLITPALIYMVISGEVAEISAGGVAAKFREAARSPVEVVSVPIEAPKPNVVEKAAALQNLQAIGQFLEDHPYDRTSPTTMTVELGKYVYRLDELKAYVQILSLYRDLKYVVILDVTSKFLGYMPAREALKILEADSMFPAGQRAQRFVDKINGKDTKKEDLKEEFPQILTEAVSPSTSRINALQTMVDKNQDTLAIVTKFGELMGVIEREQLLSELVLKLAAPN